jgi:molybdate transport system regulatory protein
MQGANILLGPGKADLLDAIERCGTIRDAATALDMSYMRAWTLLRAMNAGFRKPLVVVHRGGTARGGAELTPTGKRALELYRELEREALEATKPAWDELQKLLRTKA